MLEGEIMAVYFENYTKHTTPPAQRAGIFNVKQLVNNNHCASQV